MVLYTPIIRPLLMRLEPERAHALAVAALAGLQRAPFGLGLLRAMFGSADPRLRVSAFGLTFPNPVGLAAGFDKDGRAVRALAALGFGHLEVGTVTPRPQPGQPRPRLFRLEPDEALINRLGFPSRGAASVRRALPPPPRPYVLGVNIGPNAASVAAGAPEADCRECLLALADLADYVTLNLSSPNTPGLRDLQLGSALDRLLAAVFEARERARPALPLLVKLSPDLSQEQLAAALETIRSYPLAGVVATNTTAQRPPGLRSPAAAQAGGLSGRPLRAPATEVVRAIARLTEGRLPIIAVGGVFTAADALEKLQAGATLVQLYTGLVYQGPGVARAINRGLLAELEARRLGSVSGLVGRAAP